MRRAQHGALHIAGSRETLAHRQSAGPVTPGSQVSSSGTEGSVVAKRTWNRVSQEHGNAVDATTTTKTYTLPEGPAYACKCSNAVPPRKPSSSTNSSKPTPLATSEGVAQPRAIGNAQDRVDAAFTLAPAFNNKRATSASPDKQASCKGVQSVSVSVALGSAPASSNTETISARSEGDK